MKAMPACIACALILLLPLCTWLILPKVLSSQFMLAKGQPSRIIIIPKGASTRQIVMLITAGLPDWREYALRFVMIRSGKSRHIKAGDYLIEPGMTYRQLITNMDRGLTYDRSIRFTEGWRLRQWIDALAHQPMLRHCLDQKSVMRLAKRMGRDPKYIEGLFFPSTYRFNSFDSDIGILCRAHKAMNRHLRDLWQHRQSALPYHQPYDAVIVASIIERESGYHPEFPLIASVIVNRLKRHWPLGMDATVRYGLGNFTSKITKDQLKAKHPYNTYKYKGLPPTAIANPGFDALYAAMHPAKSTYLYFVATTGHRHVFASDIHTHRRHVKRYRLLHKQGKA